MEYDVIVIGAGLSGLSAASLLAKRGLKVAVIEQTFKPGGSCGIFKRKGAIFDQGSAMMYGFGERGFNGHRFIFNALEEKIDVIKHKSLYCVYYKGKRIEFHYDIDKYIEELAEVFPEEKDNIKRFYRDMSVLYDNVISENPVFSTPDEVEPKDGLKQAVKHPLSYIKFLSFINMSTKTLLKKYFKSEEILCYFNKLTSTYCYTNVEETPAVLSAIMFIDNHRGGSFYPYGSTINVPGILEKVIEENGGEMIYEETVDKIIIENNIAKGVILKGGKEIYGDNLIYSGTVWNLYGNLIDDKLVSEKKKKWAKSLKATYPSVILYALVKKDVIPLETTPITLFTENENEIDENEVTAYIFSIDDKTICPPEYHTVMAIGPTFRKWPSYNENYQKSHEYIKMKKEEEERLLNVMEKRFPGFIQAVVHREIATPLSIEKYTMKNNGSVAGPLQSMGQHMLHRLHTKSEFKGLYCCGESTVMGTGTPTVTVTGISAANAILKKLGLEVYSYDKSMKNYVIEHEPNYIMSNIENESLKSMANKCQFCENPQCMEDCKLDIRGINRRLAVGNFAGAYKLIKKVPFDEKMLLSAEKKCVLNASGDVVKIDEIIRNFLKKYKN